MAEIVLDFQSFDMEPDTTAPVGAVCRFDYLEIWDGYPTGIDQKQQRNLRVKNSADFQTSCWEKQEVCKVLELEERLFRKTEQPQTHTQNTNIMALLFIRNVLLDERLILWLNCELKCSNSSLSLSGASYWSILWFQTARSCDLIHRHSLSQHPHRQRHHQGRLFSQLQHPNRLRPTSATTRLVWDFQFNLKVLILYIYFIICQSLMFVKVSLTIFSPPLSD